MKTREPRRRVLLPARMRHDGAWVDVSIRNISTRGMLIHSRHPVKRGAYVEIRRDKHVMIGRAVWASGGFFGERAQDRMDVDAIVARPDAPIARRPDGLPERRHTPRDAWWMAERSHALGRTMQFAAMSVALVCTALFAAVGVHRMLERPVATVSVALAGHR